jgi:hypothetical protein
MWDGVMWTGLVWLRIWTALVNSVLNIRVPETAGKLSSVYRGVSRVVLSFMELVSYSFPTTVSSNYLSFIVSYFFYTRSEFSCIKAVNSTLLSNTMPRPVFNWARFVANLFGLS